MAAAESSILTTVFGAVASCVFVHIGLSALGLDPLLHAAGNKVGEFLGLSTGVAMQSGAHCMLDQATANAGPISSFLLPNNGLPSFEFNGNQLVPVR